MGIHCQINLFKPADGAYAAGSSVTGVIKYGVDEVTTFDKITVSLKGHGSLIVRDERRRKRNSGQDTFRHREVYVDTDHVTSNEKQVPHEIGMYETSFNFQLGDNLPPSLHYHRRDLRYKVKCDIIYYIRIKFERPGFLQFAKRFKKEITVISSIKPTLMSEPIIYGEQKKLFQLFSNKNSIINIKANIKNPVVLPGGKIDLDYEVCNDSSVTVKGVESKLVELHTFTSAGGRQFKMADDVRDTDAKTGSIKPDETRHCDIAIDVPSDKTTIGFSSIVSRKYFVRIITELPFPHINAVMDVPVEIGDVNQAANQVAAPAPAAVGAAGPAPPEYVAPPAPPSYWEAMGEETKDDDMDWEK